MVRFGTEAGSGPVNEQTGEQNNGIKGMNVTAENVWDDPK